MNNDDETLLNVIAGLEIQKLKIDELKASPDCALDKRALAIAIAELETSMLWLANSRP